MVARFEPNYAGIREFLRMDPVLAEQLYAKGQKVLEQAKSIAPVGDPVRNRNKKEHPGTYRDSLKIRFHVGPSRMSVQVYSTDQKRYWIEYGSAKTPKHAVLRRALSVLSGSMAGPDQFSGIEGYFAANPKAAQAKAQRAANRKRHRK